MTKEEAREILIEFQAWRRDNSVPPLEELTKKPTEIGIAIDVAIKTLSKK